MNAQTPLALDPTTLLFTISILGFATAAFAFSSSRANGADRLGLVEWGKAMSGVGASFLLFFLRGHAPPFYSYVVANCIVLSVPAYGLLAHTRFFALDTPRRTIAALVAFGISGLIAVHVWHYPLGVGVFTMSSAMAGLLAMTGWSIIRMKGLRPSAPSTFAAVTILLLAAVCIVRAAVSIAGSGASVSLAADRSQMAWPLIIGTLFVVGATIGFVMMVHDKQSRIALQSSKRDTLTGLHTRAAFFDALSAIQARGDEPYALVVLDVDCFKLTNDTHGHTGGDLVLAHAGRLILRSLRSRDLAGRFGGDEFCVVLPGCGQAQASRFSERLIFEAGQQSVPFPDGRSVGFTLSAGYATRLPADVHDGTIESAEHLFERADAALFAAKRAGRKRAVAALQPTAVAGEVARELAQNASS